MYFPGRVRGMFSILLPTEKTTTQISRISNIDNLNSHILCNYIHTDQTEQFTFSDFLTLPILLYGETLEA